MAKPIYGDVYGLNRDRRSREYLYDYEVERLIKAARNIKGNKTDGKKYRSLRNTCIIWTAYTHALRLSEIVALRWAHVDLKAFRLHLTRRKQGTSKKSTTLRLESTHPIYSREAKLLRRLREHAQSPYVFETALGDPIGRDTVQRLVARLGKESGLEKEIGKIHTHMLRHSAGFELINRVQCIRTVQDYMGHVDIKNTVEYTRLKDDRFEGLWA